MWYGRVVGVLFLTGGGMALLMGALFFLRLPNLAVAVCALTACVVSPTLITVGITWQLRQNKEHAAGYTTASLNDYPRADLWWIDVNTDPPQVIRYPYGPFARHPLYPDEPVPEHLVCRPVRYLPWERKYMPERRRGKDARYGPR